MPQCCASASLWQKALIRIWKPESGKQQTRWRVECSVHSYPRNSFIREICIECSNENQRNREREREHRMQHWIRLTEPVFRWQMKSYLIHLCTSPPYCSRSCCNSPDSLCTKQRAQETEKRYLCLCAQTSLRINDKS